MAVGNPGAGHAGEEKRRGESERGRGPSQEALQKRAEHETAEDRGAEGRPGLSHESCSDTLVRRLEPRRQAISCIDRSRNSAKEPISPMTAIQRGRDFLSCEDSSAQTREGGGVELG